MTAFKDPEARFFERIVQVGDDPLDSCWEWTWGKTPKGYGFFSVQGKQTYAHRWAYEFFRAEIPAGLHIDHLCRNRSCANPWHLEPVSPAENYRRGEMQLRRLEAHAARTHCKWGHPFSGDNLRLTPRGHRRCVTCERTRRSRRNKEVSQ
jgi:hypothetical protein